MPRNASCLGIDLSVGIAMVPDWGDLDDSDALHGPLLLAEGQPQERVHGKEVIPF